MFEKSEIPFVKLAILLFMAVFIFISFNTVYAKQEAKVRYISKSDVNLRNKPSTKGKVVAVLHKGQKVYAQKYKNGWIAIWTSDGLSGWVHEKFISSQKPVSSQQVSSRGDGGSLKVRYINGDGVNLRSSPSLAGSVVKVVSKGTKVYASGYKNGWISLALDNGTKAWVHEKFISSSRPETSDSTKVRYIIGNNVNVRQTPSFKAKILDTAGKGEKVIVETYNDKGWIKVAFSNGIEGWIHEKFVGTSSTQTPGLKVRYIIGDSVNIRSKPSTKASIVGKAKHGEKIYVETYNESGWAYVSFSDGVKGWVNDDFIASSSSLSAGMKIRYICGNGVNVRKKPSLNANVVTVANSGDKAFVESYDSSGWIKVLLEGSREGWVNEKFLTDSPHQKNSVTASKIRYIQGNGVNVRSKPSLNASVVTTLNNAAKVYAEAYDQKGWVLLTTEKGSKGWVYEGYVGVDILPEQMAVTTNTSTQKNYPDNNSSNSNSSNNNYSNNYTNPSNKTYSKSYYGSAGLVDTAYSYMGVPYVWGGTTAYGFDCSGFVQTVCAENGISITRTADAQFNDGVYVDRGNLQPGDLVFFTTYTEGPSHVGIYIGNSEFIHASSGAGEVTITNLNDGYYSDRFLGGRRVTK